ncbi:hypothetical protein FGO68_gene8851 [Halteria grandinella]|uniref:Uncharacterized protein n=1 Tax=Halteria grandinella TaxID=5974 RepID=A0A8J8P922_HALGN|nr:hypothetical protein FGO68_gene8851 [Halteria grandinella]
MFICIVLLQAIFFIYWLSCFLNEFKNTIRQKYPRIYLLVFTCCKEKKLQAERGVDEYKNKVVAPLIGKIDDMIQYFEDKKGIYQQDLVPVYDRELRAIVSKLEEFQDESEMMEKYHSGKDLYTKIEDLYLCNDRREQDKTDHNQSRNYQIDPNNGKLNSSIILKELNVDNSKHSLSKVKHSPTEGQMKTQQRTILKKKKTTVGIESSVVMVSSIHGSPNRKNDANFFNQKQDQSLSGFDATQLFSKDDSAFFGIQDRNKAQLFSAETNEQPLTQVYPLSPKKSIRAKRQELSKRPSDQRVSSHSVTSPILQSADYPRSPNRRVPLTPFRQLSLLQRGTALQPDDQLLQRFDDQLKMNALMIQITEDSEVVESAKSSELFEQIQGQISGLNMD